MDYREATGPDTAAMTTLLCTAGLPYQDLSVEAGYYLLAISGDNIVGLCGIEPREGQVAMLRSLVVREDCRGQGIAGQLYMRCLELARERGVGVLYLLTEYAGDYFRRRGFMEIPRDQAPDMVRSSAQFSTLCPQTALLMYKNLAESAVDEAVGSFRAGYFCAESVLMAVAKRQGIESPLIPAIATGFCSGVSRTSGMCGALTGGILGLNLVYGRDRELESVEQNYQKVQQLISGFEKACGSTNCTDLLGCDLGTPAGQQWFREQKLARRCLGYAAVATDLAIKLS